MNKTRIWIAMHAESGETRDGKPRVLKARATKDEAQNEVRADIEKWADNRAGENVEVDFDKMSASYRDRDEGREWNIEEVEIEVEIPE